MAKQNETKTPDANSVQINTGNIDVLKVKLLADIVHQLNRIANALEEKK